MANDGEQDQDPKKFQYPLDPNSYTILDQIGRGCSATVYKAICTTNTAVVAIKSIDLDRTTTNEFDNVRREAKTMSLLSHPNILEAHCSFTVGSRLWVVMPFMSAGSLQSIIAASFPDGISEPCISIILKETLMGLCYLHDQGHLHRDIKAGNILMDSNGSIKLGDFGVSASVYESTSRSLTLNEVAGTPYWMAPEVIHSHNGYSYKADMWSFGITALELAHGKPPLSHLPFSKSLVMKITKRFRFSDYQREEEKSHKNRKFSKSFKDMVGLCLDQDPFKRPCADRLLKHSFFKNSRGSEFLVKHLLQGLPSVEQRFKLQRLGSMREREVEEEEDTEECLSGTSTTKHRRISGWNFNVDCFELDPVFPFSVAGFGGTERVTSEKAGESDVSNASSPRKTPSKTEIASGSGSSYGGGGEAEIGGVDREVVVGSLMALKRSLDDQREKVMNMLNLVGGVEAGLEISSREEQLMQVIEKLRTELENEKRKRSDLEMELEFLKLQSTDI